jgi:hypothetical protein
MMLMMERQKAPFLLGLLAPKVLEKKVVQHRLLMQGWEIPVPPLLMVEAVETEVAETEVAGMEVAVPQVPLGPVTENERVA